MPSNKPSPDASLAVNGTIHKGWTEVTVTRSLEQFAHTFEVSFTERWSDKDQPIPIREGDQCVVKLGDEEVVTGYIDDPPISYDANDHTMSVSGRSITGDLVDCSAIFKKGQWRKSSLETIAKDLCDPFGLSIMVETDLGDVFPSFSLQDGETVYETLERACRIKGVLLTTSPQGDLVFTAIGSKTTKTVIEKGKNVIKGARSGGWKDRYSQYTVKAQAPGNDQDFGISITQPVVTVTDTQISRYRPLVIQAEQHAGGTKTLTNRANWERNVRAGRSQRLAYTLDGWENKEGLWHPNTLVRVIDSFLQIDTTLLVISVRQTKGAGGTNTDLELADPRAMTVEPLTNQPKGKSKYLEYLRGSKP